MHVLILNGLTRNTVEQHRSAQNMAANNLGVYVRECVHVENFCSFFLYEPAKLCVIQNWGLDHVQLNNEIIWVE